MDVLVLDSTYQPISRVSWQTAFGWLFEGKVEVIEEYADRVVRTACEVFAVPSIVRFVKKVSNAFRKRGVRFNRRNLYIRDQGQCQYCQRKVSTHEFTYDHVIPRKQGGTTCWENIVVACVPCNRQKADRTPQQAKMYLKKVPGKPKYLPDSHGLPLAWNIGMPESWKDWLGSVSYWTDKLEA